MQKMCISVETSRYKNKVYVQGFLFKTKPQFSFVFVTVFELPKEFVGPVLGISEFYETKNNYNLCVNWKCIHIFI